MIDSKILKILNEQIKHEFDSAHLYLSMSAYLEGGSFPGMASWMRLQAQEEHLHAMKFFTYIHDRGGKVILEGIDKPKASWKSTLDIFTDTYKHEQKVTNLVNNIADIADKMRDRATLSFIQWYIDEQVEEEANASLIVEKLKMINGDVGGLMILDKELGTRIPPVTTAEQA